MVAGYLTPDNFQALASLLHTYVHVYSVKLSIMCNLDWQVTTEILSKLDVFSSPFLHYLLYMCLHITALIWKLLNTFACPNIVPCRGISLHSHCTRTYEIRIMQLN